MIQIMLGRGGNERNTFPFFIHCSTSSLKFPKRLRHNSRSFYPCFKYIWRRIHHFKNSLYLQCSYGWPYIFIENKIFHYSSTTNAYNLVLWKNVKLSHYFLFIKWFLPAEGAKTDLTLNVNLRPNHIYLALYKHFSRPFMCTISIIFLKLQLRIQEF